MKAKETHTKLHEKFSQNTRSLVAIGLVHLGIILLLFIYVEIKSYKQEEKFQMQGIQILTLTQKFETLQEELQQSKKEWKKTAGDHIASKQMFLSREQGILGKSLL